MGDDPERDGLRDTPRRVVRAMLEMTAGMTEDPAVILSRTFEDDHDQVVVVRGISFNSLCEHHLLPFNGVAHVGYIPTGGRVVGLSKIPRLVECFARRPQMQERLAQQVADALVARPLEAKGAAVVMSADHSCMTCRGIKKPGAEMVTSVLRGAFMDDPAARAEFFQLVNARAH